MTRRLMDRLAERDRGILTQADRNYLRGETELQPQSERKRRQQIRERVWNAVFDFWLLVDHLAEADWDEIFDQRRIELNQEYSDVPPPYAYLHENYRGGPLDPERLTATTVFEEALIDMIAFGCQAATRLSGGDPAHIVERGMNKALREYGKTAAVSVTDVTEDYLREQLEDGTLTLAEFWFLLGDYSDVGVVGDPLREFSDLADGSPPESK